MTNSNSCDYFEQKNNTMAGNRTRINCLEGSYADHYTTIASCFNEKKKVNLYLEESKKPPCSFWYSLNIYIYFYIQLKQVFFILARQLLAGLQPSAGGSRWRRSWRRLSRRHRRRRHPRLHGQLPEQLKDLLH